ncbi:ubiquinone biosynthesis protein Coq4 [Rhexocercosporidium sp. MPI-PUGE-AT-0058]|nr:ubiquinone biosynthesis protein Coq4 [Rhexocercosporidium sp. MPI-PUGE-AT-0058]
MYNLNKCETIQHSQSPTPNYPGHIPLTRIEKAGLAIGSAFGSLYNPYRGDLIAALGEATATPYFIYRLRDAMLASPTGRRILKDRPRITSESMRMEYLRNLPENTVGRAYADWLDLEGVSPDTRSEVQYIDDEECAYVMQRYRECHDFYHALTGLPIIIEGEIAVKAFEFANTLLPMTGLSLFAYIRLKPQEKERFWKIYLPWAVKNGVGSKEVINIYWEEQLERDVGELRAELGIEKPINLRAIRKAERLKKKAEKEAKERSGDSLGIN